MFFHESEIKLTDVVEECCNTCQRWFHRDLDRFTNVCTCIVKIQYCTCILLMCVDFDEVGRPVVSRPIRCYLGTQKLLVLFFIYQMIAGACGTASPEVLMCTGS